MFASRRRDETKLVNNIVRLKSLPLPFRRPFHHHVGLHITDHDKNSTSGLMMMSIRLTEYEMRKCFTRGTFTGLVQNPNKNNEIRA